MNNYIGPGNAVTVTIPYARNSGDGALVGAIFGVAFATYASGATGVLQRVGIFTGLAKASGASEAWAPGDRLYWSDSNKNLTKNSTGNFAVGYSLATIGTAVTTAGNVLLEPSPPAGS